MTPSRIAVLGVLRIATAVLAATTALASTANARILRPWGSSLTGTPTLDTANGASYGTRDEPTRHVLDPFPHDGADLALWNTHLGRGRRATAPAGGQVLAIRIKGCALKDRSARSQLSAGVPVNQINFQALAPSGGGYIPMATATGFRVPFCSRTAQPARRPVTTSTITTFHPLHLCIAARDAVDFYDIGGFIPNQSGPSWYPEGVPFEIIKRLAGSSMASFEDANASQNGFVPGEHPLGANSGWGTESGQEVMLQVTEGTGADAYGLCPGGTAEEPLDSNQVICVYRPPLRHHRRCTSATDVAAKPTRLGRRWSWRR